MPKYFKIKINYMRLVLLLTTLIGLALYSINCFNLNDIAGVLEDDERKIDEILRDIQKKNLK